MPARITDCAHSNYVPILDGGVLVWDQYDYLRHSANLSNCARLTDETINITDLFPQSHMLLEVDTGHVKNLLSAIKVHNRIARSLDFLGTVLKVVAGTQDADDLERIKVIEAQFVESNNRQVVINSQTQNQINHLTNTVNRMLESTKKKHIDTAHLFSRLCWQGIEC